MNAIIFLFVIKNQSSIKPISHNGVDLGKKQSWEMQNHKPITRLETKNTTPLESSPMLLQNLKISLFEIAHAFKVVYASQLVSSTPPLCCGTLLPCLVP